MSDASRAGHKEFALATLAVALVAALFWFAAFALITWTVSSLN